MAWEDVKAVKKEEPEEDTKSIFTSFANNGSRNLKKEETDQDNKPIKIDEKPFSKGLGGQFQTTAGPTVKQMSDFLSHLTNAYHDDPETIKKFVKICMDREARRLSEASTIAKVVELLKEHEHLLRAFTNIIDPMANTTIPNDHKRKRALQSDDADIMNKPKTRSQSRRDTDAA